MFVYTQDDIYPLRPSKVLGRANLKVDDEVHT
jgi:hypothetical protein